MRTSLALLIAGTAAAWSANDASVAQRGPHHALWQRVTARTTSYGKTYYVTNSYLELGTFTEGPALRRSTKATAGKKSLPFISGGLKPTTLSKQFSGDRREEAFAFE